MVMPALLAVVLAGCGADSSGDAVTPQDAEPALEEQILGVWYPWDIPSYEPSKFGVQTFGEASVEFKDDGTWSGSDGCNGQSGEYEVAADGKFSASEPGVQTMIGCANVPNASVLHSSFKAEIVDGVLVLSSQSDQVNGRYVREPQAGPSPTASAVAES
ncbi:hypothetical protein GCM10027456_42090 [Kineosporia babensis]